MKKFISFLTSIALAIPVLANGLTKQDAQKLSSELTKQRRKELVEQRQTDFDNKAITLGNKTMPYKLKKFGCEPKDGHSLYITMHGGGGVPKQLNDQQWKNQIRLYKPKEGYYLAPRAATNTWNLWHEPHIDPMFDRLIENFVVAKGVNPNKVYITGFSAGGDGTYQLAPRMADRWAAAAMMAGHPNDAQPDNLYNLPFFSQCGGKDTAYNRHLKIAEWGKKLEELATANPGAYKHKTIIYPEHGHWMDLKDAVAYPWMAKYTRNPWPKKIVWLQDNVTVQRFYWLINEKPSKYQRITAEVDGQTITLTSDDVFEITLRLSDQLIDLDKKITVRQTGVEKPLFKGKVPRTKAAIKNSLQQRFDPSSIATAELKVEL